MKILKFISLMAFAAALSGCMTNGTNASRKAPVNLDALASGSSYLSFETGPQSDPNFKCPANYNIVPNYDWDDDAYHSNYYTVCRSKSDPTQLKVFGVTMDAAQVCAIPVNTSGSGSTQRYLPFSDPTSTSSDPSQQILSNCFTPSKDGVEMSFASDSFSFFFIVTSDYLAQMQECIYSEVYSLCPRYSFGAVN